MKALCVVAIALAGCPQSSAEPNRDPQPPPPPSVRFEHDMMVRYHMHESFDLARAIERLLIRGKLDETRNLARAIADAPQLPDLNVWAQQTAEVRQRAGALADAPGIDEACRREARLAVACAQCHVDMRIQPEFRSAPAAPPDRNSVESRMARHRWAADRLWEGMIAGDDENWRAGIDVLAAAPLAWPEFDRDRKALGAGLQRLAQQAKRGWTTDSLDERGRKYGEMLVTCTACHSVAQPMHP